MSDSDSTVFELDHKPLALVAGCSGLAEDLSALAPLNSQTSFNDYCREACRLWGEYFADGLGTTSERFDQLDQRVRTRGEGIIATPWGGVVVTRHEPPLVEKYLVIRRGGYLALETHAEKREHLEVREGTGLILWRRQPRQPLAVEVLEPGASFDFEPGMEHCIIGTEDLLVFERSSDPKGMDQDLIFFYSPA